MRILAPLVLAAACVLPALGCDREIACTDLYAYGLNITVTDQASGMQVCTATVTAKEGTYQETLTRFSATPPCTYVGAGERAGTYEITATASGFAAQTITGVTVTADECHVTGVARTIALAPE